MPPTRRDRSQPRSDPTMRGRRGSPSLASQSPSLGSDPTTRGRRHSCWRSFWDNEHCSDPTTRGRRRRHFGEYLGRGKRFRPDNEGTATFFANTTECPNFYPFRPDNEGTAIALRQGWQPLAQQVPTRQRGDDDFSIALFRTDSVGKQFGGDGRMRRCGGFKQKGFCG